MPNLMINCPTTGKPVSVGMAFDQQSFDSATLINNSFGCSSCGAVHTWNKKDAFLEGSKPPSKEATADPE